MKKVYLAILLLYTAVGIFAQTSAFSTGKIQDIRGNVETKLPGSDSFVTAKIGNILSQDTVISTGFKSFAVIEIGYTSITVRPLTCLTLTEIQTSNDTENLSVSLQSGRVRVDVHPPSGTRASVSVVSPTAVASVRGTSFEFDTLNLYVDNGSVNFRGKRGQVIRVNAGSESKVQANARVTSPVEVKTTALFPKAPAGAEVTGGSNRRK